MFNELLNEVKTDKKKQVEGTKNVNINVNTNTNKNVAKKEADDIEDMLANLWLFHKAIIISNINNSRSYEWQTIGSKSSFLCTLDLEHFLLRVDISKCIFVYVFGTRGIALRFWLLLIVLVQQRVLEISDGDAVFSEEPFLEFLDECCLQGSDVAIEFNDLVAEKFDFFKFKLVVSFGNLLLFDKLEFFLIDDVLSDFLLSLTFFLLM